MSVRLYDEAIVNKINGWIKDDKLRVLSPEDSTRLFQMRANQNNDEPLTLPLIAISRNNEIEITNTSKRMLTYDGIMLKANEDKTLQIDGIPMTLNYQIDIYTRHMDEADEYMRNFVFSIINHPKIKVQLPYNNIDYEHYSYMRILSTIEDNSDIPQKLFPDQFTRWTIRFTVDDAYLFSLPYKDNIKFEGYEVEIVEKQD